MKYEEAMKILRCYKEDGKKQAIVWYGKEAIEEALEGYYEE